MSSRLSACKCWCITLNNYTSDEYNDLELKLKDTSSYYILGKELCPTTSTPHIQGYVRFKRRLRFNQVKSLLNDRAHLEVAKGSTRHNFIYCSKSGDYTEGGDGFERSKKLSRPKASSKEIAKRFIEIVSLNEGYDQFVEEYPHIWLNKGRKLLDNYFLSITPPKREDVRVLWLWGSTGKGKSTYAHNKYPNAYIKNSTNKWWCGYQMEKQIIIDEYGVNGIDMSLLLTWFQPFKVNVEIKGGSMPLFANRFIVTSNYSPSMLFGMYPNYAALLRRIHVATLQEGTYDCDAYLDKPTNQPIPLGWHK